jgi:uncharacterized protein (DUF362 family)
MTHHSHNNPESPHKTGSKLPRRDFFKRIAGASVAAAAAAGGAAWLYKANPALITNWSEGKTAASLTLPDFSINLPADAVRLAIAHGPDPAALLPPALNALGGVERFIKKGDVVIVKPNVAFSSAPMIGATTNPDLVAAVVRLALAAGAAKVIVTDNPINQPERCFEQTGVGPAAAKAGAQVFIPTESSFAPLSVPGGTLIQNWPFLHQPFKNATKVIGVAPIKDHTRALASMSMKNWYGLLGGRRNQFHQDINDIIKELAMMIRPTLVILDGTKVMMRHGPTGGSLSDLSEKNTLIVSTDQVAADAVGYTLLDRDPAALPYLRMAADLNLGQYQYKKIPYVEFNHAG